MARPMGITLIAVCLLFLAIAGFLNGFFNPFANAGAFYYLKTIGALLYGALALATAIGLLKMKPWSYRTFLTWSAVVFLNLILPEYYLGEFLRLRFLVFLIIMFVILYFSGRYISKNLKAGSIAKL